MEEYAEKVYNIVNGKSFMNVLYLTSFMVVFATILYRMFGALDITAFFLYFLINWYLTTTTLIFYLLLSSEIKICIELDTGPCLILIAMFLLPFSLCFGFFWLAIFVLLRGSKEEIQQENNDPERVLIIQVQFVLCSVMYWGLFLVTPIGFDREKDKGFWIAMALMMYFGLYCYSVYVQTRVYLYEIEWMPYLHPLTWLFLIGIVIWLPFFLVISYLLKICRTNEHLERDEPRELDQRRIWTDQRTNRKDQTEANGRSRKKVYEDSECIICLENFQESDRKKTTKCKHVFHSRCLTNWLKNRKTCPLCRRSI
ncbi:unnamed protein product [Moneuplotes crassus]|uniref:RING-type domain-containing protein n=1 Tax=Euplotes crassus TaxID=5936 RepID=A0AAD1X7K9_EUPCR|nr:unnamed protein product [Moneuplotes crassus]